MHDKLLPMKRLLTLLLALMPLALLPRGVAAASGGYRVDLLVFNSIDGIAETSETTDPRSFAQLPKLDDVPLPDGMQAVPDMSAPMESIWRRLRLSADYRPLAYMSWEQSKIEYNPPLRLHDAVVLTESLRFPAQMIIADLTAHDPLALYRVPFYQLDGMVQLRLSRFLHLDLDLEFRRVLPAEPAAELPAADNSLLPFATEETGEGDNVPDLNFELRTLQQSRQVRTGVIQYFDSPFLGVIAQITKLP
jgi:hypothetical protein